MFGTVQTVTVGTGTHDGDTYALAGSVPIVVGSVASVVQAALVTVFGSGNVIVCQLPNPDSSPTSSAATFSVMFVGALWGAEVLPMAVVVVGDVVVTVDWIMVSNRLVRLLEHTVDIYRPRVAAAETPDDIWAADPGLGLSPTAAFTGVPCYYDATPNFNEPVPAGQMKQGNIFTADKWVFLDDQEIYSNWIVVMTSPHPMQGRGWILQGNSQMNASTPGRAANSQVIQGILAPGDILG